MLTCVRRLLIAVLLFCVTPAFAWNNIGHLTVAYVAWQIFATRCQARTITLIRLNPNYKAWATLIPASVKADTRNMYLFMIAATWPDQIKGEGTTLTCPGHGNSDSLPASESPALNTAYSDLCMYKYWHFVDERYSTDNTTPVPLAVPSPNLQQKIDALSAAIQTEEADPLKSYDLVWLEHLVGDVHQPLHRVSRFTQDHPTGGLRRQQRPCPRQRQGALRLLG